MSVLLYFICARIVILLSLFFALGLCLRYCSRTGYTYNTLVWFLTSLLRSLRETAERADAYRNSLYAQEPMNQEDHDENSPLIANNVHSDYQEIDGENSPLIANNVHSDYQENDSENSPLIANNVIADVHTAANDNSIFGGIRY